MNQTLRICCWVIVMLAAGMTVFMNLRAMDSVYHPAIFLPVALLPYVVLALTVRSSRSLAALVVALVTALVTLAIGFWNYYDGLFARFTTLNAILFIVTPIVQLVPAAVGWAVVLLWARAKEARDKKPAA